MDRSGIYSIGTYKYPNLVNLPGKTDLDRTLDREASITFFRNETFGRRERWCVAIALDPGKIPSQPPIKQSMPRPWPRLCSLGRGTRQSRKGVATSRRSLASFGTAKRLWVLAEKPLDREH
eukprot:956578-Prorocentrum_minimum.AAC.1